MTNIMTLTKADYLSAFMNIFWLRPETALWRTLDCLACQEVPFERPILDIGCGDGLFSFTRAGGLMDPGYDMFSQTGNLDSFYEKVDIYNHFNEKAASPLVICKPAYTIDMGVDHKNALLKKAFSTGLYKEVKQGDANKGLPVEDGCYKTIFSNILYWLKDYRTTLAEMRRALTDDGRVVIFVPSESFHNYSFYQRFHVQTGDPQWKWLHLIDRGRSDNIKLCRSYDDWKSDFEAAGLRIAHYRRYLSRTVVEAWDIGLRPISPMLIEMSNKLTPEDRREIKAKWVEALLPLMEPLCELDWLTDSEHPPGFFMFVLEKSQ